MKRLPLLIALIALPACAQSKGSWPSLAPRAIEAANTVEAGSAATAPAESTDIAARLDKAQRDLDALTGRWTAQRRSTEAAVDKAAGQPRSSEPWSTAQLELSRLEQIGNQIIDIRDQLDHIAGDVTVAAQAGQAVNTSINRTGSLIARAETLRADHARAFAAANTALPR